jgi:hypothetical protein
MNNRAFIRAKSNTQGIELAVKWPTLRSGLHGKIKEEKATQKSKPSLK